jgi:hypothetical protein
MTRRSDRTLLYAGISARRWVQAAIATPDADLHNLCVGRWRRAASIAAEAPRLSRRQSHAQKA